jgi:NAD-dependent dihydropyrimidine dehydrogenase PreA subunit
MEDTHLYEKLAHHLDQGIVGAPTSPALLEILRILFPLAEARVALKLTMQNQTLAVLMDSFPELGDSLEEVLKRMAGQGTVFTSQRPGAERQYALLPSVVGWAETPFWAGKETERTRKLAPLWLKYREEGFGEELSRGDMPVVRVLPVSKKLHESSEVLPYNALKTMVEAQSFCAVAHCPCRQMHAQVGDVCDHSLENCLHFGSMGRYMVEQGLARKISADETLKILREANEEGLVHSVENVEGHLGTICNCCGCCCVFLETKSKMGLHTISSSSYVAQVDPELCVACGTCEERCPMGAIAVGDEDIAVVGEKICIGCGVCTPTCEPEAVELALRAEAKPPPDLTEFLTVRYKQG